MALDSHENKMEGTLDAFVGLPNIQGRSNLMQKSMGIMDTFKGFSLHGAFCLGW